MAGTDGGDRVRYSPVGPRKLTPFNGVIKALGHKEKKRLLGLTVLFALFMMGLVGSIAMWATNIFDNMVLKNLVLKNNSQLFEWWETPPVKAYLKIHIFNYTNVEQIEAGLEKPRVQEVGPYTFRQFLTKVDIKFNDNGTVTYRENTTFKSVPEMSVGIADDDVITMPNFPLMFATSLMQDSNYFKQLAIAAVIRSLNPKSFITLTVTEFLWGYTEAFVSLAKVFAAFGIDTGELKLGFLERLEGVSPMVVTMETGANDMSRLGIISWKDGQDHITAWGDTNCSRIDGSDGALFPPELVRERHRLHIFHKELCHRLPLDFHEEIEMKGGITAFHYEPPQNAFSYGEENRDNDCYCEGENATECPVAGILNMAPCYSGLPLFVSFPHYFTGSKELFSFVDEMEPNKSKHGSYIDVHPIFGVPMSGQIRVQTNAKVRKSILVSQFENFDEGTILPIAWIEMGIDELPPEIQNVLNSATFIVHSIKFGFMYGSLALAIVTGLILLGLACHHLIPRRHAGVPTTDSHIMEPL